ncbi:hypothetical protein [Acinetobacter boissieri]|uniref:Uncharacterized protein n=1 Tax=Acinetobacter boissieri TaxID=1219383 RepID=A0A1G6JXQ9_9GAMM|nr:hypothetical protein [Acinetobacter boissieri]SDC23504.1 hypothetical protein SAMN05421733_11317 [Acinetobacter boissieri]
MNVLVWILLFLFNSLVLKWILSWGGAKWISRYWLNVFVFGLLFSNFNEEQVKAWALIIWFVFTLWFIVGLISPQYRIFNSLIFSKGIY